MGITGDPESQGLIADDLGKSQPQVSIDLAKGLERLDLTILTDVSSALDAVIDGSADVGPVDGYALDLLRRHGDERARRVRVIATTDAAPSAPLVASPMVDADARERLTAALLDADRAGELAATLDELLLTRFVRVATADLDVFLHRAHAAEAAGYAKLA